MEIVISWWNTGLVPPVANKRKEPIDCDKSNKVEKVIEHIMEKIPIDIMVLCEVSPSCDEILDGIAGNCNMDLVKSNESEGKINFDIALMYETTKLRFIEKENLISESASGAKIKCGTRFLFKEAESEKPITIFASHWPSNLHKNGAQRISFGKYLRDNINFIRNKGSEDIILVGDYNDQPFADSIVEGIEATKDVQIVRKKKKLFYNPFWRYLDKRDENHTFSGSYFYSGGAKDQWYTYDQMMFSSSFLDNSKGGWLLDIDSSKFHSDTIEENELGFKFLDHFDHVPIYSKIKKNV